MNVSIDLAQMCIVHKHARRDTVRQLASMELPHVPVRVVSADLDELECFTDFELLKLYRNITGSNHTGYFRPQLLAVVVDAIQRMPDSPVNHLECTVQYGRVPADDKRPYRYVAGGLQPRPVDELFKPDALRCARDVDAEKRAIAAPRPVPATPVAPPVPEPQGDPLPRAARTPSNGVPERPRSGGATGRVWDIADKLRGTVPDAELRKAVIAACTADGINGSTASVQFGNWRKANA